MTPKRKAYLAKCSKREKLLRFKIREYELDIQGEKYRLTQGARLIEPDNTKAKGRIRMYKYHLTAYRHELARIKGMDRVVVPRDVTFDSFVIGYCQEGFGLVGVCSCGKHLVRYKHNYCPWCGKQILWERVK